MRHVRFGLIGLGYWGPKLARNLESLPQASLEIVADLSPASLKRAKQERPWITTTDKIEDVFTSNVDAVVIATPVSTHFELARTALLHGKHVLVEKPLTASVAEAEELVALARQQNRILMVGHTFQYSPAIRELRQLIQDGELGNIYCIEIERLNLGLYRSDIDVIWDLAPHDASILLTLLGESPIRTHAHAHGHLHPAIYDVAHINLDFATGATAHIHVSWLHPDKVRKVTVIGDKRMAIYDDTNPAEMLKIFNKGADVGIDPIVSYRYGAISIPHIEWVEPLRLECEDFAHAIRTGEQPAA
ncbi:MAG TPA: Gfo/Idh/MocA family oxidoreductase, partial [Ktedonobacterales bacterium]|nr:Gfo/Idh/MocA family oxidoreductase [Ktedonobacterales bacterium]